MPQAPLKKSQEPLRVREKKNLIFVPLHFSLSFQSPPPLPPPPFLIFLGTEVPACLAHDIDFHQRLEITSEPLPGQPASTFLHFLHTAAEFSFPFFPPHVFLFSSRWPQLTERRDDKCSQVESRWQGMVGSWGRMGGGGWW